MAQYLLDTTVLIDWLNDRPHTVRRVRSLMAAGDEILASPVSVEEVVRGMRVEEADDVARLVQAVRVPPIGAAEAWKAGDWRREAALEGITLSQPDCLIAAGAWGIGARLATGNPKHFPMEEIAVEHWPAGE